MEGVGYTMRPVGLGIIKDSVTNNFISAEVTVDCGSDDRTGTRYIEANFFLKHNSNYLIGNLSA